MKPSEIATNITSSLDGELLVAELKRFLKEIGVKTASPAPNKYEELSKSSASSTDKKIKLKPVPSAKMLATDRALELTLRHIKNPLNG